MRRPHRCAAGYFSVPGPSILNSATLARPLPASETGADPLEPASARAALSRARELLSTVGAIYSCRDLAAWPSVVLDELRRLIPCEVAAFNDIDPHAQRLIVELSPPQQVPPAWEVTWARYGHENAAYDRLVRHGDVGPLRLSDFLSQRELRATELYRRMYGPLGIRYQVATALEGPAPQITAIVLMRADRDFRNSEVELLRLIRPHLVRSYDTARTLAGIGRDHARVASAAKRANIRVITLDEDGAVVEATQPAADILRRHLGSPRTGDPLPEPLGSWVSGALPLAGPSIETFATRKGVIGASLVPGPAGAVVLVQERLVRTADPLPLSQRQREVLDAISGGTTNAEAAAMLNVSLTTIAKHLGNIYRRLGVQNRGAALALYERSSRDALERRGHLP